MYTMTKIKKTILAAAVAALILPASAFANEPGFYFGGKVGTSTSSKGALEDAGTSYGLHGGYRFSPYFAMEGEFNDFGNIDVDLSSLDINNTRSKPRSWGVKALGLMPVNPNFDLFGSVGLHSFDLDPGDEEGFRQVIGSSSSTDMVYGVGGQFHFANSLTLRTQYQRYEFKDAGRTDEVSLGLQFRF
jgi:OmpA-OmpF porin, OOP family